MIDYDAELRSAVDGDRLRVPPEWEGFPGLAFGGFVAAAVLVAAAARTGQPRPLSLFSRFLRPVPVGEPFALVLKAQRRGRNVDLLTASLGDGEHELASFTASFGRDGDAPLRSQSVPAMTPLHDPRPVWGFVEAYGVEPPRMMRRVGFRGEPVDSSRPDVDGPGWHLRNQWPATTSDDLAVRAAVTLLPIDCFVAPATMHANDVDVGAPWPVYMPSLDLAGWFYAPEAGATDADRQSRPGWLDTRTAVPVTHAGYAVGRTQVWAGDRLAAEGMSQVVLIPSPDATERG